MPDIPHKAITVFSGSADHLAQIYLDGAWNLGATLAAHRITLVFGGGKTGLMGAVADGALAHSGEVIGVINDGLNTPNLAHTGLTRMEVLPDIQSRKARMYELADAFIALPGGFGTFDEVFETLTWAQIGLHQKGLGFLNLNHYFDPLLTLIEHAISEHFIYPEHQELYRTSTDPETLLCELANYQTPENLGRWVERP